MPARPVFRARRNEFIDRILRSAYAKGRARGLVSGGWWLLPGGQAVGHGPPRRSSRNFRHLSPTGRGRARHLNPRSRALGSRGTSVTIRFNRMFHHMRTQYSHMRIPVLLSYLYLYRCWCPVERNTAGRTRGGSFGAPLARPQPATTYIPSLSANRWRSCTGS